MIKNALLPALMLLLVPAAVFAGEWSGQSPNGARCLTVGVAQIFINFAFVPKDVSATDTEIQAKIGEISAIAEALKIAPFKPQSVNYTLAPSSGSWRMSGTTAFDAPAAKCKELLALLKQKGFETGMNPLADKPGVCK